MNTRRTAYLGADIHDGTEIHKDSALVLDGLSQPEIIVASDLPDDIPTVSLEGGLILPGFVDLQVNGGGGAMFNDDPCVETLSIIAKAHAGIGTVAILPTLISDTPDQTRAAIDAVFAAISEGVPGIIGLHLEGPHLSKARKGAHSERLIRDMTDQDVAILLGAAAALPNLMVTVAPESVSMAQITALVDAGVIVSLGHTDADFDTCSEAFDAGARAVTHLFNAMSQMSGREPGLVGAAFARPAICAGLIADGIHVHPAAMQAALAAKGARGIFLVTDAMATVGSDVEEFVLNDRRVLCAEGRLTLEDGTLAGAHLKLPQAIKTLLQVGEDLSGAVARATSVPASLLRNPGRCGQLGLTPDEILYSTDGLETIQRLSSKAS